MGLCCLALGQWQWNKGAALEARNTLEQAEPLILETAPHTTSLRPFTPITIEPPFTVISELHLLHQFHQGQPGMRIFSVIQKAGWPAYWLIDRGFCPKTTHPSPLSEVPLHGIVIEAWKNPFIKQTFPLVGGATVEIERLDLDSLSQLWHHPVSSLMLKLDEGHPDTLLFLPRAQHLTPERHRGYAFQWWGLSAVVCFGMLATRKHLCKKAPAIDI
jgi:cytochrome oxidase assembly protein ShyY1